MSLSALWSLMGQTFPSKPTLTEANLPDLKNKVYLVTGANSGVGKELSQMLYAQNAKVYIAARSETKALAAMDAIKAATPNSAGDLVFLPLDLADLSTIRATATAFLAKEPALDVLFNNAGVAFPDQGSKTAQGHELQLGVNCLGHFLLTKLLAPALVAAAKTAPRDSVRVVWVSSSASEGGNPNRIVDNLDYHVDKSPMAKYQASKIGNVWHATEFAGRLRADGVVSVALNPGNLDSGLYRNTGSWLHWFIRRAVLYPTKFGAYPCLFAGLSPAVTMEKTGVFIAPWGRFWTPSKPLQQSIKSVEDGGTGMAQKFWEWSEIQVKPYV